MIKRHDHITFAKPNDEMVRYIADNMREIDKFECMAVNHTPLEGLETSIAVCPDSRVFLADGEPIGAMGSKPLPDGGGVFWLLGTDKINSYPKEFMIKSFDILKNDLMVRYSYLTNCICMEHKESVRWLKKLGAEFMDKKYTLLGREFRQFFIYRG